VSTKSLNAAVLGAGGFAGGELLRLLVCHPRFELKRALSNTNAGNAVGKIYPNLAPFTDVAFESPKAWSKEELSQGSWTLFSALGHVQTMRQLSAIIDEVDSESLKIVDLSGDFRLNDASEYKTFYGHDHEAEHLLSRFVYGLPEIHRDVIREARFVANPGCFATGSQLAILPMAASNAAVRFVAVDAKTGSSGGGIKPAQTSHHPNRMNNFSAYKQLTHQHLPEILMGWQSAGGSRETDISFVPQRAPMVRGIFVTAHFHLDQEVDAKQAEVWYRDFYEGSPFVRVVDKTPFVSDVWGTNYCDISVTASGRCVVACAAIDNLTKGAAGQAIQNANLMNGLDETEGLLTPVPNPI
jgi:N-acetyl-gamma-glutamyl-phosphate/LysW-gamma-L-alpha-aminoadipyl-6-phosphate reductase